MKRRCCVPMFVIESICLILLGCAHPPSLAHQAHNTYGIDYEHPEKYLHPGTQTVLTDEQFAPIASELQLDQIDVAAIQKIYAWKQRAFTNEAAGGKYVGRNTITDILNTHVLTGCHDHGLVIAAILRKYGIPAVYVDTTGVEWALNYPEQITSFQGHVFVEAFVHETWMLFDSTSGAYIPQYDPTNPLIPMKDSQQPKGYYVMFKGLDPADYGITRIEQLTAMQKRYARMIKAEIQQFQYPNYIKFHYAVPENFIPPTERK